MPTSLLRAHRPPPLHAAVLQAHLSILLLWDRLTTTFFKAQVKQAPACCSTKQNTFNQTQVIQLGTANRKETNYNTLMFRVRQEGLPVSLSTQLIPTICQLLPRSVPSGTAKYLYHLPLPYQSIVQTFLTLHKIQVSSRKVIQISQASKQLSSLPKVIDV